MVSGTTKLSDVELDGGRVVWLASFVNFITLEFVRVIPWFTFVWLKKQ